MDFCSKYRLPDVSSKSLTSFLSKLREKKQSESQIKQADSATSGNGSETNENGGHCSACYAAIV